MTESIQQENRRILIIDDNEAIHQDIGKILIRRHDDVQLDDLTAQMLGESAPQTTQIEYEIDSAYQGEQGLGRLNEALHEQRPYAVALVDMRMPPGWDGIETIERLWAQDPELQVVICTAYSDYSWEQMVQRLGQTDRMLILKKPFDEAEVRQIVCALSEKWNLARMVQLKTTALQKANERLQHEISRRAKDADQFKHDALHDALTNLPNRHLLMERLVHCIERSRRKTDLIFAVLFLDLDNFKGINDTLGHGVGDELLIGIAERIQSQLRSLDTAVRPTDDTAARLGGDEFVVLLDGIERRSDVEAVADRIYQAMADPFHIAGNEIVAKLSMGIAISQNTYDDPDDVLRDADTALYQAKAKGKHRYEIFNSDMRDQAAARTQLENDLRLVIDRQQLRLQYQPIVSLASGAIEGFEALLRWDHDDRGAILPDEFIPIADETGMIVPIGEWVIDNACRQLQIWHDRYPRYANLFVSVNVSHKQLVNSDLFGQVNRALHHAHLDPRFIKLEPPYALYSSCPVILPHV